MRPISLALVTSVVLAQCALAADVRHFEDAALHAIQFVDRNEGWAAGDEGVVWHTIDGGSTWERQPTGVRSSLRSLCFLDPYVGWAAGREELPGGGSVGVLLFTRDGGLKWQRVHRNVFPGLNHIAFVDAKTGFALGDGTDSFPTGVFATADGGRSWRPIPGPRCPSWLAASFQDGKTGAMVGSWSRLATLREGVLGAADVDTLGGRSLRGLLVNGKDAVAVGQGGVVLLSDTAGVRWGFADLGLATELRAAWDFHGVHGRGDHIWVVGRPGSAMLHSSDRGRKWQVVVTGQPLPLNAVFFMDEQHGWAVGELGSILATTDGGKTWKPQHRGGHRAAALFVHSRPGKLPLDTMAQLGGEQGYLCCALRVHAADPSSAAPQRASDAQRWSAAVNQSAGAAGEMLWQFPVPQHLAHADKKELIKAWDRLHMDRGADQFLRQMVLSLRIWRPSVVISDHPDPSITGYPADGLAAEALHEAFTRAADPKVFPEQIHTLGLEPWQASKLYCCWHDRAGAQVAVDANAIAPRLEDTIRNYAAPGFEILSASTPVEEIGRRPEKAEESGTRFYRLLESQIEGAANHAALMDGITLEFGGAARRELPQKAEASPELVKTIRERRNLQVLAEMPPGGLTNPDQMLTQLGKSLGELPDEQASAAAFAIAGHFARNGQWTLARETYLLMVDRYPAHPRAADAYRWLVQYNSSSEARRRHELGQFLIVSNVGFQTNPKESKLESPVLKGTQKIEFKGGSNEGVARRTLMQLSDRRETRLWNQGTLDIAARLMAFGPIHGADPATHFCINAARRNLVRPEEIELAHKWYAEFRNDHAEGPWREAAAAELWLANRSGPPPKSVALCRQTALRPFLDGEFDDACWQDMKPIIFRNAVHDSLKEYPTEAWLAYDKDFVYLALRCRHPEGGQVTPVRGRQHDADLRNFDRVSLLLDLDRDYSTAFHLQVDQRGCVHEDCWGDRTWNPRWFVAVKSDKTCWQIEAAIPMTELTGDTVTVGKAWACNVTRIVPGRGVQAMSLPADAQPRPEGMGLLLFAPEPSPKPQMMHAN